jgi:apolipoprotein N-acyltransferase
MKLYKRLLLILLSAAMLIFAFTDNLAFIAWFALVPYFIVISKSNMRSSIFLSMVSGILFFSGITYWFTQYSYAFWFPIVGILSIFFIVYGIFFKLIYAKIKWLHLRILFISTIWVAVEFFRHRTFLAFPWGVIGYSQHAYLPVMQISKLTGVLGVSLLIVIFNLFASEVILYLINKKHPKKLPENTVPFVTGRYDKDFYEPGNKKKTRFFKLFKNSLFLSGTIIVTLVIINALSGIIYIRNNGNKYYGETLDIAMIQTDVSFDDKFKVDSGVLIPDKTGTSGKYFKDETDLVVFPESVIWGELERDRNKTFYQWVKNTAKDENLYFIMGQILWDENENYYNSVRLYNPDLEILGRYNKMHPLPCAEYMPYPDILGFLSFLNIAKLNITPADEFILIHFPGIGDIGSNICFESTLQVISKTYRKMGVDILFTFTDTAGFRDSIVGWHHLIFSRVRAIENNSFMVHSGNNGISAIVDPFGRILAKTDIGTKDVLYGSIYFNGNKSFYSQFGELLLYMYSGAVFIILLLYIFKSSGNSKHV